MGNNIKITLYGADQICASCVGAPGSRDTYEWLQAALGRKYVTEDVAYEYVNINETQTEEKHKDFVERIFEEDLFYPIVFIDDDLVAEGVPNLKFIYKELDQRGLALKPE